jgi:hypothetical protein
MGISGRLYLGKGSLIFSALLVGATLCTDLFLRHFT